MAASSKALGEWKERYEAYRQHATQYLTVLSIMVTGLVVGLVFAMGKDRKELKDSPRQSTLPRGRDWPANAFVANA